MLQEHEQWIKCDMCERTFHDRGDLQRHTASNHESNDQLDVCKVFLSHHEEEDDDEDVEFNLTAWDILVNGADDKCLSKEEEKDILKFQRRGKGYLETA